jgi:sulfite exporter TauE/SafE
MTFAIMTGLTLGLASSMHCLGMCGPLLLALPQQESSTPFILKKLLFHFSRIWTYLMLGLTVGIVGIKAEVLIPENFHSRLAICCGCLMLLMAFSPKRFSSNIGKQLLKPFYQLSRTKSYLSEMVMGMINGLLPCGMVYIALTMSFTLASVPQSILLMLFFGLGTLPALLSLEIFKRKISVIPQKWLKYLKPATLSLCAILLFLRGFGVPLPHMKYFHSNPVQQNSEIQCHSCK